MKKNLFICLILLVAASVSPRYGEPPSQRGFSIHGVGLGWPDERVERLAGPELPGSDCPDHGSHLHRYSDGLLVRFNDLSFTAEAVYGHQLELDGKVLVQEGDPIETIAGPPLEVLPLNGQARLVARPGPVSYFDEEPKFGWKPVLTKGLDQGFRVSYRYESDDGTMTDAYDFDLVILAHRGRVQKVSLQWMGH